MRCSESVVIQHMLLLLHIEHRVTHGSLRTLRSIATHHARRLSRQRAGSGRIVVMIIMIITGREHGLLLL